MAEDCLSCLAFLLQVWLTCYNLLMEPECRRKYEYTTHNKAQILKLRGSMNGESEASSPPGASAGQRVRLLASLPVKSSPERGCRHAAGSDTDVSRAETLAGRAVPDGAGSAPAQRHPGAGMLTCSHYGIGLVLASLHLGAISPLASRVHAVRHR